MEAEKIIWMAQSLLATLKTVENDGFMEKLGYGAQLTKLMRTVERIKCVLDLQGNGDGLKVTGGGDFESWFDRMKDAVYELEDIVDEMLTLQESIKLSVEYGTTAFSNKVRLNFSKNIFLKYVASFKVNNILKSLDPILKELDEFTIYEGTGAGAGAGGKSLDMMKSKPIVSPSEELEDFFLGRDFDMGRIIEMLCDNPPNPYPNPNNSVVAIVGMGGMGKSFLAHHIYHDAKITQEFQFKIWVTVSGDFDVRSILSQFLESITGTAHGNTVDELSHQILTCIHGKRYLLVLDDIWNENHQDWQALKALLPPAAPLGSKWLVTTRSVVAARSVGDGLVYELQALSGTDSWDLFQKVAFSQGNLTHNPDQSLLDIAKSIVSKCAGVPLALRHIATSLRGHGLSKWFSCKNSLFANISPPDDILLSLKLSYDNLSPALKHCFSYCALFPKAYHMDKESLIYLWLAQGYIIPDHGRTPEDTGEEYFSILLNRCFFQDIKLDSYGEIRSCKMHDLMHDLASSVAGRETSMASPFSSTISEQTRHLSVVGMKDDSGLHTCLSRLKNIRTYLDFSVPTKIQQPMKHISCLLLSNAMRLRVLDVSNLNISSLPDTVGQLPHLRYLNLSGNSQLEVLPGWLTQLFNLQTLNLSGCLSLKKLPRDIGKLVKLRHLTLSRCNNLSYMPRGLSNLNNLQTLDTFVVGQQSYNSVPDQLEVLKPLSNLKGSLTIKLLISSTYNTQKTRDAEYLKSMNQLNDVSIQWASSKTLHHESHNGHEALLEGLKPHCNIRSLEVVGYPGVTLPSWAAFSTKLVNICLDDCPSLHYLPRLSQLPHLKGLVLHKLGKLDYMESDYYVACDPRSRIAELPTFFPSLENLTLSYLPELTGWWSVVGNRQGVQRYHHLGDGNIDGLSFPRLRQLKIMECPKLVSIPPCQQVEELNLYRFNEALQLKWVKNSKLQQHSLRGRVTVDNVRYFNHLPLESHQYISHVAIHLSEREMLSPGKDVFTGSMCSIQSLHVTLCSRLKSLSGLGWKHLTSLQRLKLSNLPVLDLTPKSGDGEGDVIPWHLLKNLHYVELDFLPKLVNLPEGIQHLTALKTLEIRSCHNLKALPEWISCLANLQSLRLEACTTLLCLPDSMMHLSSLENLEVLRCSVCLRKNCQQPLGEDWPKIKHIPHISIF